MKKYILCVHGIGKHSTNWTDTTDNGKSFKATLAAIWDRYAQANYRELFLNEIEIIPIHYDDEIVKIFDEWVKDTNSIKEALKAAPLVLDQIDWFVDAIDAASSAEADDDFRFTHLMDLILFAGIQSIQDRLVVFVGNQIGEHIKEIKKQDPAAEISIIAHSMGTAMIHKVIQDLYTEKASTVFGTQTLQGDFKFKNITMVANCAYALSRNRDSFYSGVVRPSINASEGCCVTWINVGHRYDPVARFMPFDPYKDRNWLDPFIAMKGWHKYITLNGISSRDIHSLNHYFDDPELHIPFFRLAFDFDFSDEELQEASKMFEQKTIQGQYKGLEAQFLKLDVKDKTSFKDFIVTLKAFFTVIKGF